MESASRTAKFKRSQTFLKQRDMKSSEFGGLQIRDYTSSMNCSSSLAVVAVPSNGHHPPACSDRSDKYYLVAEGVVSFVVGDDKAILEEGDACLVRRGEVFSYRNHTRKTARLVLLHTPPYDHRFETFIGPQDRSS